MTTSTPNPYRLPYPVSFSAMKAAVIQSWRGCFTRRRKQPKKEQQKQQQQEQEHHPASNDGPLKTRSQVSPEQEPEQEQAPSAVVTVGTSTTNTSDADDPLDPDPNAVGQEMRQQGMHLTGNRRTVDGPVLSSRDLDGDRGTDRDGERNIDISTSFQDAQEKEEEEQAQQLEARPSHPVPRSATEREQDAWSKREWEYIMSVL